MAASAYIPKDGCQALAQGKTLPERALGAALFAGISGFTPLTQALAAELGQSEAPELTRHLNQVYDALVAGLHRCGGSVISFAGDAITCWLDGDAGPQTAPEPPSAAYCRRAPEQGGRVSWPCSTEIPNPVGKACGSRKIHPSRVVFPGWRDGRGLLWGPTPTTGPASPRLRDRVLQMRLACGLMS